MRKVFTGAYKEQNPSRQKGKKRSWKLGFLKDLSEPIHPSPFHSIPAYIQPLPWGLQKQRIKAGHGPPPFTSEAWAMIKPTDTHRSIMGAQRPGSWDKEQEG